jgi:DNA processing protein
MSAPGGPPGGSPRACDDCLRRTDLIAALGGWLDIEWRRRQAPGRVLALGDDVLLAVAADRAVRRRYEAFDPDAARALIAERGLDAACRCDERYPAALRDLPDPPGVLHVAGNIDHVGLPDSVAVVGARRASDYGLTVARDIGRALSAAGVSVVSGLALGADSAAHTGALEGVWRRECAPLQLAPERVDPPSRSAPPVAVLAGGADRPYPASKRRLHAAVRGAGAVVSELPPGYGVHRWAFVARNRLIAALARVVVVVEATERSGSLTTADFGAELGRTVAAVPGRVTCRLAEGTNGLLRDGAVVARGPIDVLDALAELTGGRYEAPRREPAPVEPRLGRLLDAIGEGHSTLPMLAAHGLDPRAALIGLGELEAQGLVRRGFGGRYELTFLP